MGITEFFSYSFAVRALIGGVLIAVITAVLGVFLVLRKLSLLGEGLGHVSFTGIALGLITQASPFYVAVPVVLSASLAVMKLAQTAKIYGDAAIGMVSAFGVAAGVLIAHYAGGFNVDLMGYLFGSILAITTEEIILLAAVFILAGTAVVLFYHDLAAVTFDPDFAKVAGIKMPLINNILVLTTGLVVVLAIKLVGIMLVSSLLVIPPVTALQAGKSFRATLCLSAGFSLLSVLAGIYAAFALDLPAGAVIVMLNLFFFCLAFGWRKLFTDRRVYVRN